MFRNWIIQKFLPAYAKEAALEKIEKLQKENSSLRSEIQRLNAYIDGLETGTRVLRRITIRNEVNGHEYPVRPAEPDNRT